MHFVPIYVAVHLQCENGLKEKVGFEFGFEGEGKRKRWHHMCVLGRTSSLLLAHG